MVNLCRAFPNNLFLSPLESTQTNVFRRANETNKDMTRICYDPTHLFLLVKCQIRPICHSMSSTQRTQTITQMIKRRANATERICWHANATNGTTSRSPKEQANVVPLKIGMKNATRARSSYMGKKRGEKEPLTRRVRDANDLGK